MNKKQIDRLLRLVDFLRELPSENFNMGHYGNSGEVKKKPKCRTIACVAGWSTLFFPELELCSYGIVLKSNLSISGSNAISHAWGMGDDDVLSVCYYDEPFNKPEYSANKLMKVLTRCANESGYDIVDEE